MTHRLWCLSFEMSRDGYGSKPELLVWQNTVTSKCVILVVTWQNRPFKLVVVRRDPKLQKFSLIFCSGSYSWNQCAPLSALKWTPTRWRPATPVYAEGRRAAHASPVIKKTTLQPHAAKILLTYVPEKARSVSGSRTRDLKSACLGSFLRMTEFE